eukprot:60459-Ditylum_brightwellii.AAC.1
MRQYNGRAQVWLARLQTATNPTIVGEMLYSGTLFDLKQQVQSVVDINFKEEKMKMEASLTMEATFSSKEERNNWFDHHSLKDPENQKDYDLCK